MRNVTGSSPDLPVHFLSVPVTLDVLYMFPLLICLYIFKLKKLYRVSFLNEPPLQS